MRRTLLSLLAGAKEEEERFAKLNFLPVLNISVPGAELPTFGDVLLLLHFFAALHSLVETVIPLLSLPTDYETGGDQYAPPSSDGRGLILWGRTIEAWATGQEGVWVRQRNRVPSLSKQRYLVRILLEPVVHWRAVESRFARIGSGESRDTITEIIASINELADLIRAAVRERLEPQICADADSTASEISSNFTTCVQESDGTAADIFERYAAVAPMPPPTGGPINDGIRAAKAWRIRYLHGEVSIADQIGFQHHVGTPHAHLYSLWAFAEMSAALLRSGRSALAGQSCIAGRHHQGRSVHFQGGGFVFYDARSRRFEPADRQWYDETQERAAPQLLPATSADWILHHPLRHALSTVIGTSHEGWRSDVALQTFGHTANYGVRRGAVIFNGNARKAPVAGSAVSEGVIRLHAHLVDGREFFVCGLRPGPEFEECNARALDDLLGRLWAEVMPGAQAGQS